MSAPTISIITPVYNLAAYLETTMRSVLETPIAGLEYIVMDGGSTDGSVEIIRRYADRLAYWQSEPDEGMYDAINKGFERSTGEIMGWLNADDIYFPWTLRLVQRIFADFPEVEWLTTMHPVLLSVDEVPYTLTTIHGYDRRQALRGLYIGGSSRVARSFIQQESTFWRRSLWDRAGSSLNTRYQLAADYELWMRFFSYAELVGVRSPLAGFRTRPGQLSGNQDMYMNDALHILSTYGGSLPSRATVYLLRRKHRLVSLANILRVPGLLARTGLVSNCNIIEFNAQIGEWQMNSVLV
jgi:glycosyltransferase involved in cell wall biosynthesis